MSKTALIVDDSPLAQHVLSKLLAEHDLAAETAPSAEAALEYLKQRRPDVIFMDHLMPGMDGFEALEAIKTNPATATIPVMMYTSQEGELYVGQARALGAFGVLPKDLKPVEVARVLQALHLIPDRTAAGALAAHGEPPGADTAETHRVKELLEELFYQQRAALREEIREGYQRALATTQTQLPLLASHAPSPRAPTALPGGALALVLALALVAGVLGYLYFNANALVQTAPAPSAQLIASADALTAAAALTGGAGTEAAVRETGLIEALEWAVNLAGTYAFDEIPLDDRHARTVSDLVHYLERAGFRGTIALEVHVGRFCVDYGAEGTAVLVAPERPATECAQVGWPQSESIALGRRQTLAFANTISTATDDAAIRVQTASAGAERPAVPYPPLTDYITAGEWNEIAALNHRIDVRLIRDANGYLSREGR